MKNKTKKIILELLDFYPGTIIMPIIFITIYKQKIKFLH